jgi:hypothetical protein
MLMTTLSQPAAETAILDNTRDALLGSDIRAGVVGLHRTLRDLRDSMSPNQWKSFAESARTHPLHRLLLESPFTRRAFTKPRGYAGDAGLMDLIYSRVPDSDMSPLGAMLYAFEFDTAGFLSVRMRRAILAREIDLVATARPSARVMAVACGHLREIEWSRAARNGEVSVLAIDQDS